MLNYFLNSPFFNNSAMQGSFKVFPAIIQNGRKKIDYNTPSVGNLRFFAPAYNKMIFSLKNISNENGDVRLYSENYFDIFDDQQIVNFSATADNQTLNFSPYSVKKVPAFTHYVYDCKIKNNGEEASSELPDVSIFLDDLYTYVSSRADGGWNVFFDAQNLMRPNSQNTIFIKIEGLNLVGHQILADGTFFYNTDVQLTISFVGNYSASIVANNFMNRTKNPDFFEPETVSMHEILPPINSTSMVDSANYLQIFSIPIKLNVMRNVATIPPDFFVQSVESTVILN